MRSAAPATARDRPRDAPRQKERQRSAQDDQHADTQYQQPVAYSAETVAERLHLVEVLRQAFGQRFKLWSQQFWVLIFLESVGDSDKRVAHTCR